MRRKWENIVEIMIIVILAFFVGLLIGRHAPQYDGMTSAANMDPASAQAEFEGVDSNMLEVMNRYFAGHVQYQPEVVRVSFYDKTLYIQLPAALTIGTDGSCQQAGAVMSTMLEHLPEGWQLYVTNDWVPSLHNPIDLTWARVLARGNY